MATGTLLPIPRHIGIDAGIALPGAKMSIFSAGTSTPVTTYSDVGLTTANANPVVADADGLFGPIYIPAISVKIVLKDSADVVIFTQDNVASYGLSALASLTNGIVNGRLTIASGQPVVDQGAASSIRFTPYLGNRIALYDGAQWNVQAFSELTVSPPLTANKNYDIFIYDNAGTLTLEHVVWSTDLARATALALQDGVFVKSGEATKRYLGTVRCNGSGTFPDNDPERFVWNMYNRVPRRLLKVDTTDSWVYTTATWRAANGSTANRVSVVIGVKETLVSLRVVGYASNSSVGVNVSVGIGDDTTTINLAQLGMLAQTLVVDRIMSMWATRQTMPEIGHHFFQWLEISDATGATTWRGDSGITTMQAGMDGWLEA